MGAQGLILSACTIPAACTDGMVRVVGIGESIKQGEQAMKINPDCETCNGTGITSASSHGVTATGSCNACEMVDRLNTKDGARFEVVRRHLMDLPVTLNGVEAKICGASNDFAEVYQMDSGLSAEWSWEAVRHVCMDKGGAFHS